MQINISVGGVISTAVLCLAFNSEQFLEKEIKLLLEKRNRYRNFKTQNPSGNKMELLTGPLYQQESEKTRQRIHPLGIVAVMRTGQHIQPAIPWVFPPSLCTLGGNHPNVCSAPGQAQPCTSQEWMHQASSAL